MAVDDHSRYKYSGFMKNKSDIGDFAEDVFKKVQASGHMIKYIHCDNTGENIRQLQDACDKVKGIAMEYTAPSLRNRMEWLSERSRKYGTWAMQ